MLDLLNNMYKGKIWKERVNKIYKDHKSQVSNFFKRSLLFIRAVDHLLLLLVSERNLQFISVLQCSITGIGGV